MSSALKISIVIAILLVSQVAFGQRGRGGFRGGGDRGGGDYGGRGFQRGGPDQGSGRFQRGGPDQRGGGDSNRPAPSDDSGRGSSRTAEFLKKLDANGNGMIEASEATDPGAKDVLERVFKKAGMEPHYPVLIADLLKGDASSGSPSSGVASKSPAAGLMSPPGMGFGSPPTSGGGSASTSSSTPVTPTFSSTAGANSPTSPPSASSASSSVANAKPIPHKPARFRTALEQLPKGLPEWFLEKDVHHNGQITMAEYTTNWTPDKVAEFNRYDLNHDGIITAAECLKVEKGGTSARQFP